EFARTKSPPELSYSKYLLRRFRSKSSQKIQPRPGLSHSLTTAPEPAVRVDAPTTTVARALLPSTEAVMVAVPIPRAVTSPLELTVAIEVLLLDQLKVLPLSVEPLELRATAESCRVPPTWSSVEDGLTVTVATTWEASIAVARKTAKRSFSPVV